MQLPLVVLAAALVAMPFARVDAQSKLSRRMAEGKARDKGSVYEVEFSDAEESVLKAQQGETVEGLARMLSGRSVHEVQRRCVELGLRCGASVSAPPKNSEKWRVVPSRG